MLDPTTGRRLWERHRIAAGTEWIADGEAICGCTARGRDSIVLAVDSGRLLETCDLPERRQRVALTGRQIVAVRSLDSPPGRLTARRVQLDRIDPLGCRAVSLGEFPGESRGVETGDGRLAVLQPDGGLTMFDLASGAVVFRVHLEDMPRRFERLAVQPWFDRYLVLAGGTDEDEGSDLSPLQPLLTGQVVMPPLSASIWAIDRQDGQLVWPAAAVVERHDLLSLQADDAPVLIFGKLLAPAATAQESLVSFLCLDKRTGHAVAEDERLPIQRHRAAACQVTADPEDHSITITAGRGGDRLVLTFSGLPDPPRPPYAAGGRGPSAAGIAGFLRRAGPVPPQPPAIDPPEQPR